jgi:hypothetical protein
MLGFSQWGTILLPPRGYLAKSGDIFGCHILWEKGFAPGLVDRGQGAAKYPKLSGKLHTTKNELGPVSIVPRLRSLLYRISNLSNLFRFIVL